MKVKTTTRKFKARTARLGCAMTTGDATVLRQSGRAALVLLVLLLTTATAWAQGLVYNIDYCKGGVNKVHIAGWVYNPYDKTKTLDVHVIVSTACDESDPNYEQVREADVEYVYRKDVNDVHNITGTHGFRITIDTDMLFSYWENMGNYDLMHNLYVRIYAEANLAEGNQWYQLGSTRLVTEMRNDGIGTDNFPYIISNKDEWDMFSYFIIADPDIADLYASYCYLQTADVGSLDDPVTVKFGIADTPFTGHYDGNGKSVYTDGMAPFISASGASIDNIHATSTSKIGNGTETTCKSPFAMDADCSQNFMLFPRGELGQTGMITAVSFQYAYTEPFIMEGVQIYMKTTNVKSSFSGKDYAIWRSPDDKVFEGTFSATGAGWVTITLDKPFYYDGSGNLLVWFYDPLNNNSYTSDYVFYGEDISQCSIQDRIRVNYSSEFSPSTYTYISGSKVNVRPNIRFTFCNATPVIKTTVLEDATEVPTYTFISGGTLGGPFVLEWKYSWTQTIYPDIGKTGEITAISFNYAHTEPFTLRDVQVFLSTTDKFFFSDVPGFVYNLPVSGSDKVFQGTVSATGAGWVTINLDKPFTYDGNGNLLVCLYVTDGWDPSVNTYDSGLYKFYCKDIGTEDSPKGIAYCSDVDIPIYDIESLRPNQYQRYHLISPSMQLHFKDDMKLHNTANNTDAIVANNGRLGEVKLQGRTFYRDRYWNTVCLPFNVEKKYSLLSGADVRELRSASLEDGTLTLNFSAANEVTTLTAGTPYIFKWTGDLNDNYANPSFCYVTLNPDIHPFTSDDGKVTFTGNYDPFTPTVGDKSVLFLGVENNLFYPNYAMNINAFRGFFHLNDPSAEVKNFVLSFDGEDATSIHNSQFIIHNEAGAWYSLDGRRLSGKPTKGGLYIYGNKKVVIK